MSWQCNITYRDHVVWNEEGQNHNKQYSLKVITPPSYLGDPRFISWLMTQRLQIILLSSAPPSKCWGSNLKLGTTEVLSRVGWQFVTNISGKCTRPIFKGQAVKDKWAFKTRPICCPEMLANKLPKLYCATSQKGENLNYTAHLAW